MSRPLGSESEAKIGHISALTCAEIFGLGSYGDIHVEVQPAGS